MKPKRVGFHNKADKHPVYEYRGFFIGRSFAIAHDQRSVYFTVYRTYTADGGLKDWCDWNDVKRLKDACQQVDLYLDR